MSGTWLTSPFEHYSGDTTAQTSMLQQPHQIEQTKGLIEHQLIDWLGPTTNVLILALFLSKPQERLTREDVRKAIETHKEALSKAGAEGHLSRVRDGKATVNFWIDRLVESNILDKEHSNPVVFWLNTGHEFVQSTRRLPSIVYGASQLTTTFPSSLSQGFSGLGGML